MAYYPALALFAVVFTSLRLSLAWTTMTAVAYALVCWRVGAGLDLDAGDEKVLLGRLAAMYALVLCVSLITQFERMRRQAAVDRERKVQQERIEFSQAVHDTTAQTAYLISLGIHRARELVGKSDEELAAALGQRSRVHTYGTRPADSIICLGGQNTVISARKKVAKQHPARLQALKRTTVQVAD